MRCCRRLLAGPAVAGLLAVTAGCGGGGANASGPDPTRRDPTIARATTTTSIDVTTVPATITLAYAQAVMDALDKVLGEALREFARDKVPTQRFETLLKAIYDGPILEKQLEEYGRIAAQTPENVALSPSGPETTLHALLGSSRRCVFGTATRSLGNFFIQQRSDPRTNFVQLLLKDPGKDPDRLNPTPWVLVADGNNPDGSVPQNPC